MNRPSSPPTCGGPGQSRGILEQKLAAYRRFLSISDTLSQKVMARDMADAGNLIAWRQDCIDWIESLDSRLNTLERGTPKADAAAEALQAEINGIVKKILRLDENMISAMASFRGEVQNCLSEFTARRHSFKGYRPGGMRNTGILSVQT